MPGPHAVPATGVGLTAAPLRGLTRRLFFSRAGAIDLPEYAPAAVR